MPCLLPAPRILMQCNLCKSLKVFNFKSESKFLPEETKSQNVTAVLIPTKHGGDYKCLASLFVFVM